MSDKINQCGLCGRIIFAVYSAAVGTMILPRCDKCKICLCGKHIKKDDVMRDGVISQIHSKCGKCSRLLWVFDLEEWRERSVVPIEKMMCPSCGSSMSERSKGGYFCGSCEKNSAGLLGGLI